jgi:hypothetical protein
MTLVAATVDRLSSLSRVAAAGAGIALPAVLVVPVFHLTTGQTSAGALSPRAGRPTTPTRGCWPAAFPRACSLRSRS